MRYQHFVHKVFPYTVDNFFPHVVRLKKNRFKIILHNRIKTVKVWVRKNNLTLNSEKTIMFWAHRMENLFLCERFSVFGSDWSVTSPNTTYVHFRNLCWTHSKDSPGASFLNQKSFHAVIHVLISSLMDYCNVIPTGLPFKTIQKQYEQLRMHLCNTSRCNLRYWLNL